MSLTLREIRDQYNALSQTIEQMDAMAPELSALAGDPGVRSIWFMGCGSSFMIASSLRTIASMRMQRPVYAVASGDLWLNVDRYKDSLDGALIVSLSRSGYTSEVLRAIEMVKQSGVNARFVSIVCAEGTQLEAISDDTVRLPWAFDESVCQTRCVSNMYAAGALLIAQWTNDPQTRQNFIKMAEIGEEYLTENAVRFEALAARPWMRVVVLADGEIDGLAEEGALAFMEISQLPSNFHHVLDVRHGPMVLIGENTLVIAAASTASAAARGLLEDVIKRGATLAVYSNLPQELPGAECFSVGAEVGPIAGGLGLVNICQMISYYKSFHVGCDPDRPDGLDPWIKID